jgi:serine/threonine-protein kinase PpkA
MSFGIVALLGFTVPGAAQDGAKAPLVMDGKTSLPQRVLVRDAADGLDAPQGSPVETVRPLQQLFVYARKNGWLEVGADDQGSRTFWLEEARVIDWKQNIVAALEVAPELERTLFFSNIDAAYEVIEGEDPAAEVARLRAEAEAAEGAGGLSETVIALGPKEAIDQRNNLHVMPILSAEEAIFESGTFANILEVAVARANADVVDASKGGVAQEDFRAAVVFVVDTTKSMGPYIDATREAMVDVYGRVAEAGMTDRVAFGLVGYRDSLKGEPNLEWAAQTFVTLDQGRDANGFMAGISEMTETQVSSKGFREDSFTGIDMALSQMEWQDYSARFIVLVTDAGPRDPDDELSGTGMSSQSLNRIFREQLGGFIAVMHLKTPAGANNDDHDRAERLYTELTTFPNLPPLYFPIKNGDAKLYKDSAGDLARVILGQVVTNGASEDRADTPLAVAVGAAMKTTQLQYLGAQAGTEAPDVFKAVVVDRDFARQGLKPVSVRLLVNKAQLSDLSEALRIIVDKAEANILDPDKFFEQVLGAAADMSRRPDAVSGRQDESLAEATSISELLDGLPYRSRVMTITEEDWVKLSISEQQAFVNDLYDKLERYQRYNAATDLWVNYLGSQGASSLVYPMLLDDLP